MAYPAGVELVSVTVGSSLNFFGNPLPVKVSVTPVLGGSATRLIWAATGQTVVAGSMEFSGEPGSIASFDIPNPDQDGFLNGAGNAAKNWSYTATVSIGSQRWVQAFQPVSGQTEIDLDLVPDGQVSAPTSAPFPAVTSVNGQTGAVTISGGEGGPVAWGEVTGKPSEFPPATHGHTIGDVSGLSGALAEKVDDTDERLSDARTPVAHEHAIEDVEGLQDALDAASGGGGSPSWGNITDKPATFPPSTHGHSIGDVTGLETALEGKQPTGSYATTSQMTSGLAGKQDAGDYATNSALTSGLAGKANETHSHPTTDITGLGVQIAGIIDEGDPYPSEGIWIVRPSGG